MFPFREALVSTLVPPLAVSTPGLVPACHPRLDQSLRDKSEASALTVSHVDLRALTVNQGPDHVVYGRSSLPSHTRL